MEDMMEKSRLGMLVARSIEGINMCHGFLCDMQGLYKMGLINYKELEQRINTYLRGIASELLKFMMNDNAKTDLRGDVVSNVVERLTQTCINGDYRQSGPTEVNPEDEIKIDFPGYDDVD